MQPDFHKTIPDNKVAAIINRLLDDDLANNEGGYPSDVDQLLSGKSIAWKNVAAQFKKDFTFFEPLLFRLHFKRDKQLAIAAREAACTFLCLGYYCSQDVRYFNEFLWFFTEEVPSQDLLDVCLNCFRKNINPRHQHVFALSSNEVIEAWLRSAADAPVSATAGQPLKVGLIGVPFLFNRIYDQLKAVGFEVEVFSVPHHTRRPIRQALRYNWLMKLAVKLTGGRFEHQLIDLPVKDDRITLLLQERKLELGFHKLGFIIKNNIINGFSVGLLNDHWGLLPQVRGRSTLEYSVLMGIPVCATVHFVDEVVDAGPIVRIFNYQQKIAGATNMRQIKRIIKGDLGRRAVESITAYCGTRRTLHNIPQEGLTYYSMHSALEGYINDYILGPGRLDIDFAVKRAHEQMAKK